MIYIDSEKCIGCGICAENCLQQAISIKNNLAVIDRDKCRECGLCITACPVDAIVEKAAIYYPVGKGGSEMMSGRGWFGRGFGMGRGRGRGLGMGRGNPYPFCRFHPWLPRRWWSYGPGYAHYR